MENQNSIENWILEVDSTPLKMCTKCERLITSTPEFFHRYKSNKDGLHCWCKLLKKNIDTGGWNYQEKLKTFI